MPETSGRFKSIHHITLGKSSSILTNFRIIWILISGITGQIDDYGVKFSSNTDASGRKHTNWLNMMYPRLKLAKNLLADNGTLFVSIDENEADNLKTICDEIFGEENLLGKLVWKNATDNNPSNVAVEHEYVLVYCKNRDAIDPVWKSAISDVKDVLIKIGNDLIKQYSSDDELQEAYSLWFRDNKSQL
jgi:adenine-specific DNA-methyltransferase